MIIRLVAVSYRVVRELVKLLYFCKNIRIEKTHK